jgi:hypothetical protein
MCIILEVQRFWSEPERRRPAPSFNTSNRTSSFRCGFGNSSAARASGYARARLIVIERKYQAGFRSVSSPAGVAARFAIGRRERLALLNLPAFELAVGTDRPPNVEDLDRFERLAGFVNPHRPLVTLINPGDVDYFEEFSPSGERKLEVICA